MDVKHGRVRVFKACSSRRKKLEMTGKRTTLHCKQNGNYEELQCDDGICWCADPGSGEQKVGTRAVPQQMFTQLPCCE